MQDAASALAGSLRPADDPPPLRGARLATLDAPQHAVYAAQRLFSAYVHVDPTRAALRSNSLFYGRDITPRIAGKRYAHSLTLAALYLFEAALYDTAVRNARFVLVSDSDVPLYHAGVVYWQLLNGQRSRTGRFVSFLDMMRADGVRLSPSRQHPRLPLRDHLSR